LRGLDYLLNAQHPTGGWQRFWQHQAQGAHHFNDDTMANLLEILRDVVNKAPEMAFVDAVHRQKPVMPTTKG